MLSGFAESVHPQAIPVSGLLPADSGAQVCAASLFYTSLVVRDTPHPQ